MAKETTRQKFEEIAADYLHLAQDADGKVDALRRYESLMKLAEKMPRTYERIIESGAGGRQVGCATTSSEFLAARFSSMVSPDRNVRMAS